MSGLFEAALHVQAMRLVCEASADREQNGIEVDWNVLCQMHDQMDAMLQALQHKHRYDSSEIVDLRKDRDAAQAEIKTLRKELADAQRAVSDAFAEVNSVREQLDAVKTEIDTLGGAMVADDQRLRDAEERVWPGKTWGCDAADKMADEILHLRQQLAEQQAETIDVRRQRNNETDRLNATNVVSVQQRDEIAYLRARLDEERSVIASLREQLAEAQQQDMDAMRSEVERLRAFVGKVRAIMDRECDFHEAGDIWAALAELDAKPVPVAETAEGGK